MNSNAALRRALDEFSKAMDLPGGPSLAVQQHDPSWAAWKRLCEALALTQEQGQGGWQDIASAPKDESPVLLMSMGYIPAVGYCGPHRREWWVPGTGADVPFEPTHWRPLPPPPPAPAVSANGVTTELAPMVATAEGYLKMLERSDHHLMLIVGTVPGSTEYSISPSDHEVLVAGLKLLVAAAETPTDEERAALGVKGVEGPTPR